MSVDFKRAITGFAMNIAIVIMELAALWQYKGDYDLAYCAYYTHLSNIFALICSAIYVLLFCFGSKSKFITVFRYLCTCMLAVTIITVVFILVPLGDDFANMMFVDNRLVHHTLAPIVSTVSYIFFEKHVASNKAVSIPFATTLLYGAIMLVLNVTGKFEGPYKFLMTKKLGAAKSCLWVAVMALVVTLISAGLIRIGKLIETKGEKEVIQK